MLDKIFELWYLPESDVCSSNCLLNKWASASSSGFPENSGLKCDQYKCTTCCASADCCACCEGCCWAVGGAGIYGTCGPASVILYLF